MAVQIVSCMRSTAICVGMPNLAMMPSLNFKVAFVPWSGTIDGGEALDFFHFNTQYIEIYLVRINRPDDRSKPTSMSLGCLEVVQFVVRTLARPGGFVLLRCPALHCEPLPPRS